jgi:catechol 2,3-dioxygenase-like lactoylglutathione lyase family enzyme
VLEQLFDFSQFFHVGIRVPDIDKAMAEVGAVMGVTWASVQDRQMSVWLPDEGQVTKHVLLTYSVEGPVHLELLQGEPGSIWDGDDSPGAHHFGVWSDDPGGDVQRLLDAGWMLEMAANSPDEGYGRFAYVRSPTGFLVEPVTSANKPRFERWWAGGDLS